MLTCLNLTSGAAWSSCTSPQLLQFDPQKKNSLTLCHCPQSPQVPPTTPQTAMTTVLAQMQIEASVSALSNHVADEPAMEVSGGSASPVSQHASLSPHQGDNNTGLIAQAVAA